MCGRFTLISSSEALAEDFDLAEVADFEPGFNIAPTQDIDLSPRDGQTTLPDPDQRLLRVAGAERGWPEQPYLFRMKGRPVFALAGLHECWRGDGGEIIESAAILTTEANATLKPVHARMPVVIGRDDYARWLDPDIQKAAEVADLMQPCPDDWLEAIPVSTKVNNPRFDEPACIEPLA